MAFDSSFLPWPQPSMIIKATFVGFMGAKVRVLI